MLDLLFGVRLTIDFFSTLDQIGVSGERFVSTGEKPLK